MEIFLNNSHVSITEAQKLDQRPFRSFLQHEWIAYTRGKGFHLTKKGAAAWDEFTSTSIKRKNFDAPLTKYFDAKTYGLHIVRKRKVA